jgi:8-oxo-dGTP diphosphatase
MIFKNINVKIINGGLDRVATDAAVVSSGIGSGQRAAGARYVFSQEINVLSPESIEETLRQGCAEALVKAHVLRARSLALGAFGIPLKKFPGLGVAKILAQEIYRYARTERFRSRSLREIRVVARGAREALLFEKTITGYLEHITTSLEAGPFVTVDVIIESRGGVVLIKRSNPPFGWALPGGFLDYGETLEEAAFREAKEETGMNLTCLRQMRSYSDPERDPRFQTITTVFTAKALGAPRASSDAAEARVFSTVAWRKLKMAFDHKEILEEYLQQKKKFRQGRIDLEKA